MLLFQGLKNRKIDKQIVTELIDNKLFISFIGKKFDEDSKYLWKVTIGSKDVKITSKKSTIALSKSNTKKYLDNGGAIIMFQVGNYKSPIFLI